MNMESVQFKVDNSVVSPVYRQLVYFKGLSIDVLEPVSKNTKESGFDRWLIINPIMNSIDAFRRENGELCIIHQRPLMK